MQWFKGAMVVSSVAMFAGAFAVEGCSSKPATGDGGADVKAADSKADVKPNGDSGTQCTSGLSCEVCDVTGFSVNPQAKPIGPSANKCTTTQLSQFDTACLAASSNQTTCGQFLQATANSTCAACLVTKDTDASYGPLVCGASTCSFNIPGCLDLALNQVSQENGTNGSCGDILNASYECQDFACAACDVAADGGTDPASFQTCDNAAIAAECKSYADAFNTSSSCSSLQGDTIPTSVQKCFPAGSGGFTETEQLDFVTYFCGP
jgi:hypothetical protein